MAAAPEGQTKRSSRIPLTLQAVFLASNRGKEVNKPPPDRVAYKTFFRNWLFQRQGGSGGSRGGLFSGHHKNKKDCETSPRSKKRTIAETKKPVCTVPPPQPVQPVTPTLSPQGFLDALISSRGYSPRRYKTLQTAYYNKPSALQQASYDSFLIELVRRGEAEHFEKIIKSGISPNPCNSYGESILHTICRRADVNFLKIMLAAGANVQVADDYGRTPLHDACWAPQPAFEIVTMLMEIDIRLFHMLDSRGSAPLAYVSKDHWQDWIDFLDSVKDVYWPVRNTTEEEPDPPLTLLAANSRPIPDPHDSLTVELAAMVASGRMEPEEAKFLKYDKTEEETFDDSDDWGDSDSDDSYSSDDASCSDDETDFTVDEAEMADLLNSLALPKIAT